MITTEVVIRQMNEATGERAVLPADIGEQNNNVDLTNGGKGMPAAHAPVTVNMIYQ